MADGKEVTANTNEDPIEAALTTTRNIVVITGRVTDRA